MVDHTTLEPPLAQRTKRLFRRRTTGWIGVDVGMCAIKIAQVEHDRAGWRLITSRIIPIQDGQEVNEQSLSDGSIGQTIRAGLATRSSFGGRKAACVLPMSVMDLLSLELPCASDSDIRQMVKQELESEMDGHREPREFDFWQCPRPANERDEKIQVSVLSVSRQTAFGIAQGLVSAGLQCHVLDGLPFCLARAVKMASPESGRTPMAAIDWGFTSALFTLVVDGRPVFARKFRDCGMHHLMEAISERLQLSQNECRQLLTSYGFSANASDGASPGDVRQALTRVADAPFRQLLEEIEKTLSFLRQQYHELFPQQLWLFGGGATIRNIANLIAAAVGIETGVWQLMPSSSDANSPADPVQAVLGPAIALSALAGDVS